jgi:hypothetical protein
MKEIACYVASRCACAHGIGFATAAAPRETDPAVALPVPVSAITIELIIRAIDAFLFELA